MTKTDKQVISDIKGVLNASDSKPKPYDTTATVTRVDGFTAWVHIPGGVDETPVKLTIAAKAGDVVQVHVGGGRAWITGNASAPPTDDKTAIAAKGLANLADTAANTAKATADTAQSTATAAKNAADSAARAASTAQSKANEASEAAATAQTKADAASTAASTAQSSADTAAQAAATAQSTADAAKASASSAANAASAAQTKANEAASAAETAQSKADSAGTVASKAQSSANAAGEAASVAQAAAEAAQVAAGTAQADIDSQKEYFWHDANGAHVLGSKTAATRYRTDIDSEGMHIKDVSGEIQEVAKFTASEAQIGKKDETHAKIDSDSFDIIDAAGDTKASLGGETPMMQIGKFVFVNRDNGNLTIKIV